MEATSLAALTCVSHEQKYNKSDAVNLAARAKAKKSMGCILKYQQKFEGSSKY
jgi:hypothetical protein